MFFSVFIRVKGESACLEAGDCTVSEMDMWNNKVREYHAQTGKTIQVEFRPMSKIFEFGVDTQDVPSMAAITPQKQAMPEFLDPALAAQTEGS